MRWAAVFLLVVAPLAAQSRSGELILRVLDPSGRGARASVSIVSEANQYRETLTTSAAGVLDVPSLPFGIYEIRVARRGFAPAAISLAINSTLAARRTIELRLPAARQTVTVSAGATLINPHQAGDADQVGSVFVASRLGSLPGRSLQNLIDSQPGWLYEGNAVLHPRGSEYQTQFVIDGVPLTDNRSPSLGPEIEANDVQSLTIYTAGFPAEYGRKLGGVVEVHTLRNPEAGFHGQATVSGGGYDTAGAFFQAEDGWGQNALGFSLGAGTTSHYLNPVVPQNYTNSGQVGDFSARFDRNLTSRDRLSLNLRQEGSSFQLPNEYAQEAAGQRQTGGNVETLGVAAYNHAFSSRTVLELRGMVRGDANDFDSNAASTPIAVWQHNWFHEGYFKAAVTADRGGQEWTVGAESDDKFLNENFRYRMTDPSQFDPATPPTFTFAGHHPDLEQAAYAQDHVTLGPWTLDAGLRWDHYQLLVNRRAWSPRLAAARYFAGPDVVLHASYDRVFQTPSFANLLLSSSDAIESLDPNNFLRLAVEPSVGDDYEVGLTKAYRGQLRLDGDYFVRRANNYADDDQIENTTISFPIAFSRSLIYGAEGKLTLPDWNRFSGYLSYSYELGRVWLPVTGGLFLGASAAAELSRRGSFPDSQDQRNTARGRLRYQLAPRFWVAGGARYDSGLPFAFDGDPATVLAEYGQAVLNRINFATGRVRPTLLLDASAGYDLYASERMSLRLQVDAENLTNVLDVIDFGGLFSGNAIGPGRSVQARLATKF